MKYSLNWIRDFVDVPMPVSELSERLLMLGFEVASAQETGPAFDNVVVAEVLEVVPHPNADRLRLCDVTDGKSTLRVVCGAPNVAKGQRVPLAKVGATLAGGKRITAAKIRGQESAGMICSPKELGLADEANGIHVLPPETPLGADLSKLVGERDTALEVEVTPNRPDVLSHFGLARELSWAFRIPLKRPEEPELAAEAGVPPVVLHVEDAEACPRYVGRPFEGLKVGPSPAWLSRRLEACGLRPINNLVDITNYVLLELGHPLHAFDVERLQGPEIRARRARAGERLLALDGREYALETEDLVIADKARPVALAGVIGGEKTSVRGGTTRAYLEAAYFAPPGIRRTARRLRIRTESSYRFERGTDPEMAVRASRRATQLILDLCGGKAGKEDDRYRPAPRPRIELSLRGLEKTLGFELESHEVEQVLRGLDPALEVRDGGWLLSCPSHRPDLSIEPDIAEEVARLVGYDKIPTEPSPVRLAPKLEPPVQEWSRALRERLTGLGFVEACNFDFLSEKDLASTGLAAGPRLANPISADWVYLRPSLLPCLLRSLRYNLYRGAGTVRLFELGKVYDAEGERWLLAGVLAGPEPAHWTRPASPPDLAAVKGAVVALLEGLVPAEPAGAEAASYFHPNRSLKLVVGESTLARLGQVHPVVLKAWELDDAWYFELELDRLPGRPPWSGRFKRFSAFPAVSRDLSVVLPEEVSWDRIEQAVRRSARPLLTDLSLIDVFTGGKIPAGRRSLTMRLTLASDERTLSEDDIQGTVQRVLDALAPLGAALRS